MLHFYQKVAILGIFISIGAEIKDDFNRIQSDLPSVTTPFYELNERPPNLTVQGFAVRAPRISMSLFDRVGVQSLKQSNKSLQLTETAGVSENGKRGHVHKKKKKIVGAIFDIITELLWSIVLKFVPDITKTDLFVVGMILHAKFYYFVTHAFMVSKMALISAIVMIMRESIFGKKGQTVNKYHISTHQRHSHPHQYRRPRPRPRPYSQNRYNHHHHLLTKYIYKYRQPESSDDRDFL